MRVQQQNQDTPHAEIRAALKGFASPDMRVREQASRALDAIHGDNVAALIEVVKADDEKRAWRCVAGIGLFMAYILAGRYIDFTRSFFSQWLPSPLEIFWMGATWYLWHSPLRDYSAAYALAEFDDPRVIGPLVEALEPRWVWSRVRRGVFVEALTRLLPRLREEDAALLTRFQRTLLYKRLRSRTRPDENPADFKVAILQALAEIQDRDALPHVQRLANRQVWTKEDQRVQAAAKECLLRLQS